MTSPESVDLQKIHKAIYRLNLSKEEAIPMVHKLSKVNELGKWRIKLQEVERELVS